jgi:hypothetical protein
MPVSVCSVDSPAAEGPVSERKGHERGASESRR